MTEAQNSAQSARLKTFLLGLGERTFLLMSIFFSSDFVMTEENPKLNPGVKAKQLFHISCKCRILPYSRRSGGNLIEGLHIGVLALQPGVLLEISRHTCFCTSFKDSHLKKVKENWKDTKRKGNSQDVARVEGENGTEEQEKWHVKLGLTSKWGGVWTQPEEML